jgi:hypothetical protein
MLALQKEIKSKPETNWFLGSVARIRKGALFVGMCLKNQRAQDSRTQAKHESARLPGVRHALSETSGDYLREMRDERMSI